MLSRLCCVSHRDSGRPAWSNLPEWKPYRCGLAKTAMLGLSPLIVSCEWPAALSVRSCFEPNPEAGKATGKHTKALSALDLRAHRKMCLSVPCACLTFVLNLEAAEKARVPRKAVGMRASWSATNICSPEPWHGSGSTAPILPRFSGVEPRSGLPDACVLVVLTLN